MEVFHSLLMSHIRYGILAWGGVAEGPMTEVLNKQKRGIRHILGLGPRDLRTSI